MAREQSCRSFKVIKGNHWCEICDSEADFVIVSADGYGLGVKGLLVCKKCAEILKGKN